jgi:hypothetical protein
MKSLMSDNGAAPRTKEPWTFDLPPSGTCTPGCGLYGRCHCGCGELRTRAPATLVRAGRVKGRPYIFRRGHQTRRVVRSGGHWSRRGIPAAKVRPLLAWLHEQHGIWDQVAVLLRMSTSTIKGYANNAQRRRVPPEAARRIQQLVLAHRRQGSVLDQWETQPGIRPHH